MWAKNNNNNFCFYFQANKRKAQRLDGKLQTFSNNAYVNEENEPSTFSNNGLLNHRRRDPENDLHRTLDSMAHEIDGANFKKRTRKQQNGRHHTEVIQVPEGLKGRKFKELSVAELEELGELNASQDRFRHRFHESDYKNDVLNANTNIRWID